MLKEEIERLKKGTTCRKEYSYALNSRGLSRLNFLKDREEMNGNKKN